MEPNKMEEEFRKKLNAREVQPSEAAWNRLDAMLSVAENKKPKRNFRWLFVAAGLALFFTVGLLLFQQEKNTPGIQMSNPTMVVSEENKDVLNESDAAVSQQGISEMKNEEAVAVNKTVVKTQKNKKSAVKTTSDFQLKSVNENIAVVIPQKEPEIQKIIIDSDKLLADAEKANGKTNEKPQVKVSANSLLSSVEGELNNEFRETTLQRLNRNFKTVKTAVANRNYE